MISIIVPIYNVVEYLEKCVQSIFNQTFQDFELLLIDDGSTDGSGLLADELAAQDSRAISLHKMNGGLSDARNYGLLHASGKYVTFIDSDDWIDRDYLSYLYSAITTYKADISTCYYQTCSGKKQTPWRTPAARIDCIDSREALLSLLYDEEISVSAPGKLYARSLFESGIEYPLGMHFEDVDTTWRLIAASTKLAVGHRPLYNYVMRDNSIVHNVDNTIFNRSDLAKRAYESICQLGDMELATAAERYYIFHSLSVLRSVNLSQPYQRTNAKVLRVEVLHHEESVLSNTRAPKRDKIGIYALRVGLNFYQFAWKCYCFFRGRS